MKRWLEPCLALLILLKITALSDAAPVFQFRDDFSRYPADSDGSPTWFSYAAGWEVREGKFLSSGDAPGSQSAVLQSAPFGTRLTVEATLSITRRTNDTWKIAGVVLYADKDNFWHCALVEAPEAQGKRHYIELSEMLDGQWLAHVKLRATSGFGGDFNWQYNHPYRMKLVLTPETISGSVSELEGTRAYDFTYAFDKNKVLKHGKPGLDCSAFEGAFDDVDVRVEEAATVETRRPTFPPYQAQAGNSFRSKPTGFFRTEQRSGVWWLIDPKGFPFYVVGTDHCNYYAHWCEKLGYAPYHKNCETKFGSEDAWAVSATDRLKSWNFNTVAAGHIPSTQHRGLAHILILGLGQSFARVDDICKPMNWTGFPNVFSPKWQRSCDKQALALCGATKDDPWLIGYFIDNELEWWGKDGRRGLLGEVMQKPPDHSSKQALIEFFRKRYTGIAAFNSAWKTNLKDFEALRSFAPPEGPPTGQTAKDRDAFVGLVAERYFAVTAAAIRKADPNHLVLGCRFAGDAPEDCWAPAGKHCDVVSVNYYGGVDLERGVASGFERFSDKRYSQCRRPMMITEWSFPALDSGLPCTAGAGMRFDTQEQRAQAWTVFQRTIFTLPYMVGSDYFMWVDEPALGIASTFPENTNYGLVNEQDEPYPLLVKAATELNARVYQIHATADRKSIAGKPVARPAALDALPDLPADPSRHAVFQGTPERYSVSSGSWLLKKTGPGQDLFDEVLFNGVRLGRLRFLVWQSVGQDLWAPPEKTERVTVVQTSPLVLDVTVSRGREGDAVLTAVDQEGNFAPRAARPHSFRACIRFLFHPGKAYFLAQLLRVENTDQAPWLLKAYYHYPLSAIGGSEKDDEPAFNAVPNYYLHCGGWYDDKAQAMYGALPIFSDDFRVTFWKDPGGSEHPDVYREIDVTLKPGERYSKPQPPVAIFAALGPQAGHPWSQVVREVRQLREGKWRRVAVR